jgi:hypothetical protein
MKIWLDDQLHDPAAPNRHTPEGWVGCKDGKEFKAAVTKAMESDEGITALDLDNDLGEESLEGHELLQWMVDTYPEVIVSEDVLINIHSANEVEARKMESNIKWWRKNKEETIAMKDRKDPWATLDKH